MCPLVGVGTQLPTGAHSSPPLLVNAATVCRPSIKYVTYSKNRGGNVTFVYAQPVKAQRRINLKIVNLGLNTSNANGQSFCLVLGRPCTILETFCWPQDGTCT